MKWFSLLVAFIVILVAWYFIAGNGSDRAPDGTTSVTTKGEQGEVTVTNTDIAQNGVSRLPVGFPKGIPVEVPNITESYRVAFNSRGITQYSVSYTSVKTKDALWDLYSAFMKSSGYDIDKGSSKSLGQISGTKNNDSLSIVISSNSSVSMVQLSLLDRE
ncbi:hypothetical protein KW796_02950 [Candidatus Parcubacteria bacterium]|nr:hypothetical protein [Candidatus Parcubacteria bacterium]